jgi:cytochrome P450
MEAAPDPYRWLHFGGGVRRCLGMEFALYEIKVVLATLLRNYRFEPVDVNTECEKQGLFFSPKGSVVVKITMAE